MKTTLTYELPEEKVELMVALDAMQLAGALSEIQEWIRKRHKYDLPFSLEEFSTFFFEEVEDIPGYMAYREYG